MARTVFRESSCAHSLARHSERSRGIPLRNSSLIQRAPSTPLRSLRMTMGGAISSRSHTRIMKQILLRVPAVFAEVRFRELPQPLRRHFPSTRKIMLPQNALDPDIDRECSQPLIRKKHYAICNLRPHARQRAQLFSELGIGQRRPHSRSAWPELTSPAVARRFFAR